MGSFTAARTAAPATAIAATVSGGTADFVNGTSPKFSITSKSAPPRSKAFASATADFTRDSKSPPQCGEPGRGLR